MFVLQKNGRNEPRQETDINYLPPPHVEMKIFRRTDILSVGFFHAGKKRPKKYV